jgi:two-component system sensor histidine kinase ResE
VGIPREYSPRIFEKVHRIPGGRQAGAGLGLAIVREIVAAHGGEIDASSEPGKGTLFAFWVPVHADSAHIDNSHPKMEQRS